MNNNWTAHETELLSKAWPYNNTAEIQHILAQHNYFRSTSAIRRKALRLGLTGNASTSKPAPKVRPVVKKQPAIPDFNEWLDNLDDIAQLYSQRSIRRQRGLVAGTRKILCISDLHIPFCDYDGVKLALRTHADADVVVVNGDILDGYAFSSFPKSRQVAAVHEYQIAFSLIRMLSAKFPKVVMTTGNHEYRVTRALKEAGISLDGAKVLRPDLLQRIANGEELDNHGNLIAKHNFDNVHYDIIEPWYARVGKTIFLHPSTKPLSKPGGTVQKWAQKFLDRYDSDEVDSFVCGHTHQVYEGVVNSYKMIEQGCMAGFQAYAFNPNVCYNHNAQQGYAVIYQDEHGNTDFNASHVVYMGEVLPPKKGIHI